MADADGSDADAPADAPPDGVDADGSDAAAPADEGIATTDADRAPADADAEAAFLAWCVGAFHAAAFVAALLALLYPFVPLGELLAGLETGVGLALYLGLWGVSWWTARRALVGSDLARGAAGSVGRVLGRGALWGGVAGVAFFVLGLVAVLLRLLAAGGVDASAPLVVVLLAAVPAGAALAFLVGAVVGAAFAALDAGLARLAIRLVDERAAAGDPEPPAGDP